MKNKKAFTLIELVSVLVILAILALIVTPLVMSIIRKARTAADKRSIDAYGRSIELAIADYLLDNGTFPTNIEELTIEYSGDRVVCSTTQLNSDSSVYLAGCTVNSRAVTGYTYGKEEIIPKAYSVGDEVTYNNVDYYVIKDSSTTEDTVTLLKAEPLTVEEVNTYGGVGTANNHVNMYITTNTSSSYYQTAIDMNGYGGMTYYTSKTCGNVDTDWIVSDCTNAYANSEIKYVVDDWKTEKASLASEARLITVEEISGLGYEWKLICDDCSSTGWVKTENTPSWVYNANYWYWTMSPYNDWPDTVWGVGNNIYLSSNHVLYGGMGVVRPVITLSKSVLSS